MRNLGRQTINLIKPRVVVDARDNTTNLSFNPPLASIPVVGCMVSPIEMQVENTSERDFSRGTLQVWAPPTADIVALQPHDHVQYAGVEYEVFGQVMQWFDLHANLNHVAFVLELRLG